MGARDVITGVITAVLIAQVAAGGDNPRSVPDPRGLAQHIELLPSRHVSNAFESSLDSASSQELVDEVPIGCLTAEETCQTPAGISIRLPAKMFREPCCQNVRLMPLAMAPAQYDSCAEHSNCETPNAAGCYDAETFACEPLNLNCLSRSQRRQVAREAALIWWDNAELEASAGFLFIHPYTDQVRNFDFPTTGTPFTFPAANVFRDFSFAPTFAAGYAFPEFPKIGASGTLFAIAGSLQRTITTGGQTANLTESGSINIAYANIPEATFSIPTPLHASPWVVTLGGRYTSMSQVYNAGLTFGNGSQSRTLIANQTYSGFGLTVKVERDWPQSWNDSWSFYGSSRGSFTRGSNHRDSTFTLAPAMGAPTITSGSDTRTMIIPVGEFDLGIKFHKKSKDADDPKMDWLRVGALFHIYGNAGPFSATSTDLAAFQNSNLYLIGGYAMFKWQ